MINAIKCFIPQFSQKLSLDTVKLPGGIIIFIVHCNANTGPRLSDRQMGVSIFIRCFHPF